MTATFTTDFREEFEAERGRWLRRRFLWYSGVLIVLAILSTLAGLFGVLFAPIPAFSAILVATIGNALATAAYIWSFVHVRRRLLSRTATLRIVYWLIVGIGVITVITNVVSLEVGPTTISFSPPRVPQPADPAATTDPAAPGAPADSAPPAPSDPAPSDAASSPPPQTARRPGFSVETSPGVRFGVDQTDSDDGSPPDPAEARCARAFTAAAGALVNVFFTHFFACLFLPWTARESFRPIIPLLAVNALFILVYMYDRLLIAALIILLSPLVALPGAAICWWRHSRFRERFHYTALRGRYGEMRRELVDAQRIHEALFPAPIKSGAVRFDFRYEPMRQIGGDFLFAHRFTGGDVLRSPSGFTPASTASTASPSSSSSSDSEPLSIVIIDVTGHGIPAALTVNRLHGELMRIFSEEPDISPGDVLASLNRYVHFTLATHSVYATALCLRVDPARDLLQWASGGHPPAFLRTVDGRIDRLDSTAFVLGACHGADFKSNEQSFHFSKGDTLIAYTDGATEARDARGLMLRVEGIQRLIAGAQPRSIAEGGWSGAVLHAVDEHRFGPPADDTLLVEIWRPVTP